MPPDVKAPLGGALVVGAATDADLAVRLEQVVAAPTDPAPAGPPSTADVTAPVRVAIDYGDGAERADGAGRALRALRAGVPAMWRMLRNHGIYLGRGTAATTAFLYPGQGSQYVNMLAGLRASDPIVGQTFQEADRFLTPMPGAPLTDCVFVPSEDPDVLARAEQRLLAIDVAQPAMLTAALAVTRLLAAS